MRHRASLFVGCASCALVFFTSAASAQTATIDPQATTAQGGAASPDPQAGLEDIVVTAQKRTENLQRTPAAVTALDGQALIQQGVTELTAVQALVPSVRFQQEGATTEIYIRGVGSTLDIANIEPPTGFNFNGIYVPREGTSAPLFDVQSLQVLPGPQGTLYGRSALGGTVDVQFTRPAENSDGQAIVEVGNYALAHATFAQNLPLATDLSARVALDYTYRDGYMRSGADSRNDMAARLSALYKPASGLSVYVWGYGTWKDGHPSNIVNKGLDSSGRRDQNAFLTSDPWNDERSGPFAPFGSPKAEDQHYESYMTGAQIDVPLSDGVKLTYVPSYFYLDWNQRYWIGSLPAFISAHYNQVTQELRLSGEGSKFNWLAGLYAYNVVNSGDIIVLGSYGSNVDRNRLRGVAVFGQGTYSLTPRLRLTLGGRYSIDGRTGRGRANDASGALTLPYYFDDDFTRFDWRVGAEYDVGDASMLYGNVQTGYQPGTYNQYPDTPTFSNRVNSAKLTSFSIGIKNRFLDNRLQVNDEAFFYRYSDLFIQSYNPNASFNQIFNAKRVEVYGNQLDVLFKPTPDDQLRLSVGYLHTENKDFVTPSGQSYDGLSLQYAPEWTISGGYQHDFQLSSGYVRARVDTRYESHFWGDFAHSFGTRQQPYTKTDVSLTYVAPGDRWTLGVWAKNLENEAVQAASAAGGLPGPASVYLEAPRTFGGRATINW